MISPRNISHIYVESSPSPITNRFGSVRAVLVRKRFGLITDEDELGNKTRVQLWPLKPDNIKEITDLYRQFRDKKEVYVIKNVYRETKVWNFSDSPMDPVLWADDFHSRTGRKPYVIGNTVAFEGRRSEWIPYPVVKRGNDQYIALTGKKFDQFLRKPPLQYFSTEINDKRNRNRSTNLLYITGNVDPLNFNGIADAWLSFGDLWNTFITNVRQQFGGAEYIRAWQSQKNGYPHFHALIWIPFDFSVVPWNHPNGKVSWRLSTRQKLHKGDKVTVRQRLKGMWKAGGLDIVAVSDLKQSFKDLLKYITRDLEGGESDLTNAMAWYFGKQSYSISGKFEQSLWGTNDIDTAEPCNADLIYANKSNSNSDLVEQHHFGCIPHDFFNYSFQDLDYFLDPIGYFDKKPPPWWEEMDILSEKYECVRVDYKKGGPDQYYYKLREDVHVSL
jgi:hypothetical protein